MKETTERNSYSCRNSWSIHRLGGQKERRASALVSRTCQLLQISSSLTSLKSVTKVTTLALCSGDWRRGFTETSDPEEVTTFAMTTEAVNKSAGHHVAHIYKTDHNVDLQFPLL